MAKRKQHEIFLKELVPVGEGPQWTLPPAPDLLPTSYEHQAAVSLLWCVWDEEGWGLTLQTPVYSGSKRLGAQQV